MAEQKRRTHLSDLVRDRRAELRISLRDLADRCIDPEPGSDEHVKPSWLHRLETAERVIPPELPQLRALAEGLGLPLGVVKEAAGAQFMGIEPAAIWSENREARIVVARMDELSPQARKALADMVEAFARGSLSPGTESDHQ